MPDNVKPVKGVGFTEKERKLCIKALMAYQEIHPLVNRLSDDEKKTINLLIDDFKGPSWDHAPKNNTPLGDNFPATGQMTFDYLGNTKEKEDNENQTNAQA